MTIQGSRARDSLELASLASSEHSTSIRSRSSSPSGPPSSRLSFDNDDPLTTPKQTPNRARLDSRSYSISSAFDFAPPIFPLSTSGHGYAALGGDGQDTIAETGGSLERHKSLTYLNGLSLVIGLIIGSGIFSSPSQVNMNAGSPGASLIVWALAGILAWTGAASYAELGGAIPLNGGAQVYLAKTYGEMAGFLYSWSTVCALKPGSAAIIAIIFGEYIVRAIIGADARDASPWIIKGVALGGVIVVTLLNCISTKIAARSADIFMFFKFFALLGVFIIGIVVPVTGWAWDGQPSMDWKTHGWFEGTSDDLSQWAVAIYAGLWAYDGWDNVNYVAGEFKNPSRDLPRVIHTSVPLVIVAYLLANTSYFLVLPLRITDSSTTIAVAFGREVLGPIGSLLLALTVAGSCFGSLNATTFTSSRLFYAAAKEGYLPSIIGSLGFSNSSSTNNRRTSRLRTKSAVAKFFYKLCGDESTHALFSTPIASLALNFTITSIYIILGTFETLITFTGVASYIFYFLTVLGLIFLRVQEPHLERPYRCWITTPIIFCCVSLFLLSRSVFAKPFISLSVVGFNVIGVFIYLLKVRRKDEKTSTPSKWWKFW